MKKVCSTGLKMQPLPVAGGGVELEMGEIAANIMERGAWLAAGTTMLVMEWWRYLTPSKPQPWTATVLLVPLLAYWLWQITKMGKRRENLRLGRDGERLVAEQLEHLRSSGFRVVHDIQVGGFNLDHVAIGPSGIFAVETKSRRKRGNGKIVFDGDSCRLNGRELTPNPLRQAEANAKWLHQFLRAMTGKPHFVVPVVTFPEWWIERHNSRLDLRVLNHKELASLAHGPTRLTDTEISSAAFHLEQFARGQAWWPES